MATFSLTQRLLAYEDPISSNNPQQRPFDWSRQIQGIPVDNAACEPFRIAPLQQVTLFNGTRAIFADGTTQYSLTVLNTASNRYRLRWTGTGTAPAFRTDRGAALAGVSTTITPQLNQSVVVTTSAGSFFGSVVVGDVVYIPGLSTGDPLGIFNTLNEGFWSVLGATATQLVLTRFPGAVYSAVAETVAVLANTSFQVFSSTGVQLDDTLSLVSGFSAPLLQNYEIVSVTADALEFVSGITLPPIDSIIPGVGAIVIFSNAKSFVYLETDQNLGININGVGSFTVEPILAGDPNKIGAFEMMGTVYSLVATNKSTQLATIKVISVE